MSDRIDPSSWPTPRGPWPPVNDLDQLYDHGARWCVNQAAHPDENDGYPAAEQHVPWDECQTIPYFLDGAARDLDGAARDLDGEDLSLFVYGAMRFRFGEPRSESVPPGHDSSSKRGAKATVSHPHGSACPSARH